VKLFEFRTSILGFSELNMTARGSICAALMGAGVLVSAPMANAADGDFYGLLRSRDLTPFGFLRLDMRPAHAVAIEPGS
jgi:hypothetical protein